MFYLNIGMDRKDGGRNTAAACNVAVSRILDVVPDIIATFTSATEPTMVYALDIAWNDHRRDLVNDLAIVLGQEAIAVWWLRAGSGELVGPGKDKWGEFDKSAFLMPDGSTLA